MTGAMTKVMQKQVIVSGSGSRDLLLIILDPIVSLEWLKRDIRECTVCVVHSIQPLPFYFGLLLLVRQLCSEQVLFLAASVCASVRRKSRKLLVGN